MIREDGLAPIRVDKARKLEIFYACVIKHVLDRASCLRPRRGRLIKSTIFLATYVSVAELVFEKVSFCSANLGIDCLYWQCMWSR